MPPKHLWIAVPAAAAIVGLLFIQGLWILANIVEERIGPDYLILSTLIDAASRTPASPPKNLWFFEAPTTYFQGYFDPLVPLLNRLLDLANDPFRLLAFHTVALFSLPLLVFTTAAVRSALRPLVLIAPVAIMLHPSWYITAQADYHTSGIGIGLLFAGTYWTLTRPGFAGMITLLLGTLTKVSYWPSWLMFTPVLLLQKRWWRAAGFIGIGVLALFVHQRLVVGRATPGVSIFFGSLGSTPAEVIRNLLTRPDLWTSRLMDADRWEFFVRLLAPFGLGPLLALDALLPTIPLAIFSLLDPTKFRTTVAAQYASEYLGFLAAALLLAFLRHGPRARLLFIGSLAVGSVFSSSNTEFAGRWNAPYLVATANLPRYQQQVALTSCAVDDAPLLVTSWYWITYSRAQSLVWLDVGNVEQPALPWQEFETLIFPANLEMPGSLARFPVTKGLFEPVQYQALFERLPYSVAVGPWVYRGSERLRGCAGVHGFQSISTH